MSFTSWQFALFLPLVCAAYWRLPHRGRLVLLLTASYVFYGAWDTRFLALLLTSTTIDFYCGLAIAGQREGAFKVRLAASLPAAWLLACPAIVPGTATVNGWITGTALAFPLVFGALYKGLWRLPEAKQRRAFLLLSVLTNLGVLGFFKYFNFFATSALSLFSALGTHPGWTLPHIILPVAISFYTFQSIAYSVDIYRGKTGPARDFLTFAAYLSFFPQLISGPIERPNHLLPQFEKPATWSVDHVHCGLRLILVGLFKKVFVADNCALLANYAFDPATPLNGYWAVLGGLAFAFQIYGDFSGYTDMARGSARLLGIHLSRNFAFPYFVRTPSEFWQRWHITLSFWFRDYVYIPLGGNRQGTWNTLRNLAITMLLAGLWHGANWTFVLWGAYYGLLLVVYRLVPPLRRLDEAGKPGAARAILPVSAMWVLTLVGWAIFRSQSLGELEKWFGALANWSVAGAVDWVKPACWWLLHVAPLLLIQAATWKERDEVEITHLGWVARGAVYALLFLMAATSAVSDQDFIYFQF